MSCTPKFWHMCVITCNDFMVIVERCTLENTISNLPKVVRVKRQGSDRLFHQLMQVWQPQELVDNDYYPV